MEGDEGIPVIIIGELIALIEGNLQGRRMRLD